MSSRSINKVVLLGNLTRDPELKYTPKGTAVCTIGLATNRSWTTSDGQTKEDVQYHRVVAWQKLAELCGKLLQKGSKVYMDGRITYRDYMDKNNQQRFITEIVLDDFILLSSGKRYSQSSDEEGEAPSEDSTESENNGKKSSSKSSKKQTGEDESIPEPEEEDQSEDVNPDDIPF